MDNSLPWVIADMDQRGGSEGGEADEKTLGADEQNESVFTCDFPIVMPAMDPPEPNGLNAGCVGSNPPGDRNTFVVFLRFFHFARLFWNHTCALCEK